MTASHQFSLQGTPAADVHIDRQLARELIKTQHPDLAALPLTLAVSAWDNILFRLGDHLALRLPRRQAAAN